MPLIKRSPEGGLVKYNDDEKQLLSEAVKEAYDPPTAFETIGAAFKLENSAVSAFTVGDVTGEKPIPLDGYDPMEDLGGYEYFASEFATSESPEETAIIKSQIDEELKLQQDLQQSGGILGFAAHLAAGITDPVTLATMATGTKWVKQATTIGGTAVRAGISAGVAEIPAEVIKQSTQKTRTLDDALINIGGAAIFGSILGAGGKSLQKVRGRRAQAATGPAADLSPKEIESLSRKARTLIDDTEPEIVVPGKGVMEATEESLNLSLKNEGAVGTFKVSPLVRTQTSDSTVTREVASSMMESPLVTKGNVKGVSAVPEGGAVETRIKLWEAPMAEAIDGMKTAYSKYSKRIGIKAGRMKFAEFREEVGKAMRRGDMSPIEEVAEMATTLRKKVFDPLKDKAISAKLLPKDVEVETALSYFSRVYNHKKIIAQRNQWNKVVKNWVKQTQIVEKPLTEAQIDDVVNTVTDSILGNASGRGAYDIVPLGRGPLKERTFNIPDRLIEDFLESDADIVTRQYVRTMGPDVELSARFGRADLRDQLDEVIKDYNQKIDKSTTEKEATRLENRKQADLRDLEAMRDRLRGTYKAPLDPNSFFVRAGRSLRDINFMRMLGGMTISALPDLARPVAVNGLKPVAKGLKALVMAPRTFKMAVEDAKKAAVGLDMVLNSRASSLAEVADVYARGSAPERALRAASDSFSKLTLMSQWNAVLKQFSGVVTSDRLLQACIDSAEGTIKKGTMRRLAQAGIGEDQARRIAKQFQKYGDDGAIKLPKGDTWDDAGALDTFRAAVLKDVDRTIVTPGAGEAPLWTSSETGKLIFQFKTFASSAHHKVLLADLQHADLQALNGLLIASALGSATYGLKEYVAGRTPSSDPKKLIVESLDRSGAFGYFWDVNNIVEKASRGSVGVNPALGGSTMSRYASRNITGALLGPSMGTAEDIIQVTGATASGEFTRKDLRRLRKLMPGQNLFYVRRLLNELEEKAGRRLQK